MIHAGLAKRKVVIDPVRLFGRYPRFSPGNWDKQCRPSFAIQRNGGLQSLYGGQ